MTQLDVDHLRSWIGRQETLHDQVTRFPAAALPAYEARVRGFATQNQDLATSGARITSPDTWLQLHTRNLLLRSLPVLERLGVPSQGGAIARAATALTLPDVPRPVPA